MKRMQWQQWALGALLGALLLTVAGGAQQDSKRVVRGQVLDENGKTVATAIVHFKNLIKKEQLSVATNQKGRYQFNDVDMKADYELWAEWKGQKSRKRKISQFDTRPLVRINLRLKPAKKEREKEEKQSKQEQG